MTKTYYMLTDGKKQKITNGDYVYSLMGIDFKPNQVVKITGMAGVIIDELTVIKVNPKSVYFRRDY